MPTYCRAVMLAWRIDNAHMIQQRHCIVLADAQGHAQLVLFFLKLI